MGVEVRMVRTAEELKRAIGAGSVFVPTMGALHEGHASLMRLARQEARCRGGAKCVVSVFVNPTQFTESEDFAGYPKTLDADLAVCGREEMDAVFVPSVEEVYPRGVEVRVPPLPAVATEPGLEDRWRPGHFAGVCQVVLRLFEMVRPTAAVFGEKDWQQLQVVRALVRQEGLGIEIVPGPTVRDADGLALSSRNVRLDVVERRVAISLYRALRRAGKASDPASAEGEMRDELASSGVEAEYAAVRDAETLGPPRGSRTCRALVAGRVGKVRLIDNADWPMDTPG
ncbi:MAG TPA: pantoate--beta-alanine ligase [Phycisphaerales bacterium]|nr:pantoate--beta-alanine ligase [Phycisphaerales bacterium]